MMNDIVGASFASTIFALALLASGQNSTLTGTLAGQIVMEGFINFRIRPWLRRIITRLFAIVPAATISLIYGDSGVAKLLILSQVILCLQLPFAVVPLLMFTSDKSLMGVWVTPKWARIIAWIIALVIIGANVKLLMDAII
jgi:manganese transport protein